MTAHCMGEKRMDRYPEKTRRTRRLASIVVGSLAILALAASPTFASATVGAADSTRHVLLASELVGADDTEAADLESMLDAEDAGDQGDNVDEVGDANDQATQDGDSGDRQDEADGTNNDDQSSDEADSGDATDQPDADKGSDGDGGGD